MIDEVRRFEARVEGPLCGGVVTITAHLDESCVSVAVRDLVVHIQWGEVSEWIASLGRATANSASTYFIRPAKGEES